MLYEMITGKRAFGGENVHDSLSRILSAEPEPIAQPTGSNPRFRWILDTVSPSWPSIAWSFCSNVRRPSPFPCCASTRSGIRSEDIRGFKLWWRSDDDRTRPAAAAF